jgi:pimeloyl-ACP methyl ester carboxylesterase
MKKHVLFIQGGGHDGYTADAKLLATPFWSGNEEWVKGLELRNDFADQLPENIPIFLYHCMDDEEAPFEHLFMYAQKLPQATVHEIRKGGHQFNNDLKFVAKDIKKLS